MIYQCTYKFYPVKLEPQVKLMFGKKWLMNTNACTSFAFAKLEAQEKFMYGNKCLITCAQGT